jgi:hypothetical protein
MGEFAQLSFASKISGEFLPIWAKFPQISKFFGLSMNADLEPTSMAQAVALPT